MQFIQVLSDIGASKRGSHEGVDWLCRRLGITAAQSTIFQNHAASQMLSPPAKYIDNLTTFFQQNLPALSRLFQQDTFPIILSGDHSNAIGILSALCHAYPAQRIGVIWIDAHADLHTPYTTPSGNLHGMSLAALIRQDNLPHALHSLSPQTAALWQSLQQLAPQSAGIRPQDICFLGLRDYEPQEMALIEQFQIPHYSAEEMRKQGFAAVLAQVKQQLAAVDRLYISFDVDSLDAALLNATGTPVANGFDELELQQIFAELLTLPNLTTFELTEFNPTLSPDVAQYERVARLLAYAIEQVQKR